jgi:LPS export ABC transporter protein LptC
VKKILLQLVLLIFIVLILISTFFLYFKKNTKITKQEISKPEVSLSENQDFSNVMRDIKYQSTDLRGNTYEITSEYGVINKENSDAIYMTNVKAYIYLKNKSPVLITSKYALYNSINYETNFSENVILTFEINKLTSENLDFSFEKNIANAYDNVIYSNPDITSYADKVEIDLVTKNSRVFMENDKKITTYKN